LENEGNLKYLIKQNGNKHNIEYMILKNEMLPKATFRITSKLLDTLINTEITATISKQGCSYGKNVALENIDVMITLMIQLHYLHLNFSEVAFVYFVW